MVKIDNDVMIYEDKDGITKVSVKFIDEDLCITKYQLAEIYKKTRQNRNIYQDNELNENLICKNFLQVQNEDNRKVKIKMSNNRKIMKKL